MATLEINFETWVDSHGYECLPSKESLSPPWRYQPKGGAFVKMRPLDFHATLYEQFADIPDDDPGAYLDFMNKFGPVTYLHSAERGHCDAKWGWDSEELRYVREYKHHMQALIEDWRRDSIGDIAKSFDASVQAELAPRPN